MHWFENKFIVAMRADETEEAAYFLYKCLSRCLGKQMKACVAYMIEIFQHLIVSISESRKWSASITFFKTQYSAIVLFLGRDLQ